LDEAEEVLWVILPSDEDATLPLNPCEEALDHPPPCVSPQPASILCGRFASELGAESRSGTKSETGDAPFCNSDNTAAACAIAHPCSKSTTPLQGFSASEPASDQGVPLGTALMDRIVANTEAANNISITDAMHYRNGLIIALLAIVPVRRRTLTALRIGKHLVQCGDLWTLDIPAEDSKTKRPLGYVISAEQSARIDLYLNKFRPRISGAAMHDYLWASNRGRPMRGGIIYATVRCSTRKAFDFPVNLHRFRTAAATFLSMQDPENVRSAKDLLGHASFATTEKHYIMAQSRLAGRALARAIQAWRISGR
jgi:hypothetical protein